MHHFDYRDGVLHAEAVNLVDLASAVGTPFYCYSTATLERHYRVFTEAFADVPALVCYALKANSNQAVIRTLARLGAGADVVSGGELKRARAAGIPPDKIMFSGVGKTDAELALAHRRGHSLRQCRIRRPNSTCCRRSLPARAAVVDISVRVNPDIDAKTHAKIATGKSENKFGIPISRAREVYAHAARLPGLTRHRRRHAYRQPDHRPDAVRGCLRAAVRVRRRPCAPTATRSAMSISAAGSAFPIARTTSRRRIPTPMRPSSSARRAASAAS